MYGYNTIGPDPGTINTSLLGLGVSTWLGPPTSLAAEVKGATAVDLTWAAPAGSIDHYNVYQDGALIDPNADTSYSVTGLTQDIEYFFQVSAVNSAGQESFLTAPVYATPTFLEGLLVGADGDTSAKSHGSQLEDPNTVFFGGTPVGGGLVAGMGAYSISMPSGKVLALSSSAYTDPTSPFTDGNITTYISYIKPVSWGGMTYSEYDPASAGLLLGKGVATPNSGGNAVGILKLASGSIGFNEGESTNGDGLGNSATAGGEVDTEASFPTWAMVVIRSTTTYYPGGDPPSGKIELKGWIYGTGAQSIGDSSLATADCIFGLVAGAPDFGTTYETANGTTYPLAWIRLYGWVHDGFGGTPSYLVQQPMIFNRIVSDDDLTLLWNSGTGLRVLT